MYNKLLIPLDGSKTAESVLSFVALLEREARVPIELVSAVDVSTMTTVIAAEKARYLDRLIVELERASEDYLQRIASKLKSFDVSTTVQRGKAADMIIERAAAAQTLIAMATHGRSGLNRWLLGSVAEKVLRGTSRPLFLIRSGDETRVEREGSLDTIIVPLDGSELAASILPAVADLAKRLDVGIVLFRAYELPASAYYGREDFLPNYDELKNQVKAETQTYLDERAADLKTRGVTRVSTDAAEGLAADEIIQCVERHPNALLAMCTHGRSGVQRWVLGSVTETVVRHSISPMLVLRAA
jgi:nucleotide-binding universal stress UspA family protein